MTSRLPTLPDQEWGDDGAPRDVAFQDIYFSPEDGLSEAKAVFLTGCGLPAAWINRRVFVIGELGFGTGLNFLAAWDLWRRHRPSADARLHFVSFEGFPLDRPDAARALENWPSIADLATRLLDRWPDRARGVRRLSWPDDGVELTLHIDDVEHALPQARLAADAWFLDGFAPSRNAGMWSPDVFAQIAERSATGARAATFTVAGAVRRGLETAGFKVEKKPGHGRKRERLEAVLSVPQGAQPDVFGLRPARRPPKRVAILGAGIAGASAARAFHARGAEVVVFDPSAQPAKGASGNPLALLMPRLDAADTVQARTLIDFYLHARRMYRGLPGAEPCDVVQKPETESDAERFAKVLADPPLGLEDLEAHRDGGLLHKGAMILRPDVLIPALIAGAELRLGAPVAIEPPERKVNGETFDAIVVASGMAATEVDGLYWLPLTGKLGQVEHVAGAPRTAPSAVASGRYALTSNGDRLVGASFEPVGEAPETKSAARDENLAHVGRLSPWMHDDFNRLEIVSRAGVRATTPDRMPLIGAAPDHVAAIDAFAGMRTGRPPDANAPLIEGLYILSGFGARGFTWGPLGGAIVAAQAFGYPAPASLGALQAVSPMRFIHRTLKRREV